MKTIRIGLTALAMLTLAACSQDDAPNEQPELEITDSGDVDSLEAPVTSDDAATGSFMWPVSLNVMGNGYPSDGDPCRRLGESAAVSDYLDDSATLIGCPGNQGAEAAQAQVRDRSARVVGTVDGVTLLSVPAAAKSATAGKAGSGPARFSGSITGNEVARHNFTADEGQTINVSLTPSGTMYFNVLPPGGEPGDAIYVGSRAIDDADFWSGVAPASGDYTVIVYLMGNDRDTGVKRNYTLETIAE